MQFTHAIRLLAQRRDEVVRQMERSVTGQHYVKKDGKRTSVHNAEYKKLHAYYTEVEDELRVLKQL